jgi:tRNA pseudouridine38-40 synthase
LRVQAIISYDGGKFLGLQKQPHKNTIQDNIEIALKRLNIYTTINYSGRTDTGVHALNQSIDFEIPIYWANLEKLKLKLNKILYPHIYIKKIRIVSNDFHSRFDAKARSYRYVISNKTSPFLSPYTIYKPNLDIKKMDLAIKEFQGTHDFEYFKKNGSETVNFTRTIYNSYIITHNNYVIIKFIGNGFLRSQVRLMVGFLLEISNKNLTIKELKSQINKEKKFNIPLAPANALYFERSFYEKNFSIRR